MLATPEHALRSFDEGKFQGVVIDDEMNACTRFLVSEADEELICKPVSIFQFRILNRSLRHLGNEICAANMPSTPFDLERENFGTSCCRHPVSLAIDAPQKVSWFLRIRWLGSEPSRFVEMDTCRVSTYSSFEEKHASAFVFSVPTLNKVERARPCFGTVVPFVSASVSRVPKSALGIVTDIKGSHSTKW